MQEVNVEKLQRLQKQLQRKFDLVYPLDDEKSFFIGVADYVEAIEQSDYLIAVIKSSILPDRIKIDTKINELTKKCLEEVKVLFKKLHKLIEDKKIDNPNILAEVREYNFLLDGTTQFFGDSGNIATHLSDKVRDIIIAFKYNGYEEIAKEYEILDEHGNNRGWKISATEDELEKNLLKRKEMADSSIWGAWNDLWWAFGTIHSRYDIWDSMLENNNRTGRRNFSMLIEEWKKIQEDKLQPQDRRSFFKIDRFKSHFARVHDKIDNEIGDLISKLPTKNIERDGVGSITYDRANHALVFNDNSMEFSKDDSNQAELCRIIFADKESINKSWDREEILEGWGFKEDRIYDDDGKILKESRLKVYQTAEKINTKVMKFTQGKILDLLVFSTKAVSVNQKYRDKITFKNVS